MNIDDTDSEDDVRDEDLDEEDEEELSDQDGREDDRRDWINPLHHTMKKTHRISRRDPTTSIVISVVRLS